MRRMGWAVVALLGCGCGCGGGDADETVTRALATAWPARVSADLPAPPREAAARPVRELGPDAFDGSLRDPFQPPAPTPAGEDTGGGGPVLLSAYPIDELRLVAIVSGSGGARAMLVDPTGLGTTVQRGDYVGRGDVVDERSARLPVASWRVERIHRDQIVLVREDPTGRSTARVLSLAAGVDRKLAPATSKSADLGPAWRAPDRRG